MIESDLGGASLDGSVSFIADDRGVDDDQRGVGVDPAFEEQVTDHFLNDRFPLRPIEREAAGADSVVQRELSRKGGGGGEGVDGGEAGAEGCGHACHPAGAGEKKNALGTQFIGEVNTGRNNSVRLALGMDIPFVSDGAGAFDPAGDTVENLETGAGVLAGCGFARKHDRIGALEDGIGHVGDFRAGGKGVGDHAFEHVGGDDDRFHGGDALFENPALDDGQLLVGAFDAEIPAGDHDGIGGGDDPEDVFDGELVLDLGDDFHIPTVVLVEKIAKGSDVVGVADKGEGDPVDPRLQTDEEVGGILFRDGGEVDADSGEIDVAAVAQGAGGQDTAEEGGGILFENLQVDDPVIDEQFLSRGKIPNEIRVVDGNGGSGSLGIDREDQFVTDGELAGFADGAGPDGRPLGIEEECDFLATIGCKGAKFWGNLTNKVVVGVGHVEAKYFSSCIDKLG